MRYVFDTFKGREDTCLIWRPHPLLESTFDSLRANHRPFYDALKKEYLDEKIGIFDTTPDIESTIALSDVYIGDGGKSVTSLFGVAGKPLFIMSNYVHEGPKEDDWRGIWMNPQFDIWGNDRYLITRNNRLWKSEQNDYRYRYEMDLGSEYRGMYYLKALEIRGRIYVLPSLARHLLVIENRKIRRIELEECTANAGAFQNYFCWNNYFRAIDHSTIKIGEKSSFLNKCCVECVSCSSIIFGGNNRVREFLKIASCDKGNIKIGRYSTFNSNIFMDCTEASIDIGKDNMFSYYVKVSVASHKITDKQSGRDITNRKSIVTGNHVWIGVGATLLSGCCIGAGSIAGASSVVNRVVPDHSACVGDTAKVVKNNIEWER